MDLRATSILYFDGVCLGRAFHLNKKEAINVRRYPCFHVLSSAKIEWRIPKVIPSERERFQLWGFDDPYRGEWELMKMNIDCEGDVNLPCKIIARVDRKTLTDIKLNLSIRVENIFQTVITLTDAIGETSHNVDVGSIKSTDAKLSKKLIEDKVQALLSRIIKIESNVSDAENTTLYLSGSGVKMSFKVYRKTFESLTYY